MMLPTPTQILQQLIQFDTTNPPGKEAACIAYIRSLLENAGIPCEILAQDPERPNLLARLPGQGHAPPLLFYGHVDVVTTADQDWTHPPFAGVIADDMVWGRGALDMKGGVAMMLHALLRAQAEQTSLPGDVVLAIVSDEENGGFMGARFLVAQHAGKFAGIRYAIGEFGGFSIPFGRHTFYPIQVSEKQICWLKATVRGAAGHGARPVKGSAMSRLSQLIATLERNRLPVHITPPAQAMIEAIAATVGFPLGTGLRALLNPRLTDLILNRMGERANLFDAILHHTANPTMVHGGHKINVIPSQVELHLDGRILPGFRPEDLISELQALTGSDILYEVMFYDPGPTTVEMGLFDTLAGILREMHPGSHPIPMLLPAVTDGRFFATLGIQTYGFLPMRMPPGFNFSDLIHNADERIPISALDFGAQALYQALQRFGG